MAQAGGGEIAVESMLRFGSNRDLQEFACFAVGNIALHNSDHAIRLGEAGAVGAICKALNRFTASSTLAEFGCNALTNLTCGDQSFIYF